MSKNHYKNNVFRTACGQTIAKPMHSASPWHFPLQNNSNPIGPSTFRLPRSIPNPTGCCKHRQDIANIPNWFQGLWVQSASCGLATADWSLRTGASGLVAADWRQRTGHRGLATADWSLRTGASGLVTVEWHQRTGHRGLGTADWSAQTCDSGLVTANWRQRTC